MSSLFLLGGVPGLASCQPLREPNDSFDPIRICAKSTLCSLRACTCQLTTRPPSISTLCANQPCPASARLTCHHWVNTAGCRKQFAESVPTPKNYPIFYNFLRYVQQIIFYILKVGIISSYKNFTSSL